MGKQTRNFRNTAKSISGNQGASQYRQVNSGAWHSRLINYLKVRGKGGGFNGQS